ncbi:hypothetical protein Tco_0727206 [Tanacetum coccineum]|uniref:Uncharacterized protein n=1 Tax=Tanacetum coccineum TaxID=301880 RepID=A0ABQ4YID2_9ASTR
MQSTREEEDGSTEVSNLRDVPGSILLAVIDFPTLGLLLGTYLGTLGLLVYTLVTTCSGATTSRGMGTLRGFDPLALVEGFTPVEDNKDLLVTLGMMFDDATISQAVNKSPTHYPCDSARTFRVILFSIHNDEWKSFQCHHQTALRRPYALSWKPCQGDSLNLPDHRIHKDGDGDASFQLKSDSLPHAHAQTTKTFYKHQDSRIMKAQELKTKTSAQTLIYKIFLQRYQVYQGRLLASFQDDAKYEHVGQDTRSQGGKDDQDKQGKDLKISDIKTKSKDNDKGSRSKITKHEGTSLQRIQRPRPQDLNDKSNLIDLTKECHNELTSGEIVSLKILSRTMEVRSLY